MPRKSAKQRINANTETSLGATEPQQEAAMEVIASSNNENISLGETVQTEMLEEEILKKPDGIENTVVDIEEMRRKEKDGKQNIVFCKEYECVFRDEYHHIDFPKVSFEDLEQALKRSFENASESKINIGFNQVSESVNDFCKAGIKSSESCENLCNAIKMCNDAPHLLNKDEYVLPKDIANKLQKKTSVDSSTQQKVAALLGIGAQRSLEGFPTTDPQEFERILSSYRFSEMQDLARNLGIPVRGSIHALMEDLRRAFAKKFAGRDNII